MFYLTTILVTILLWILVIYSKNRRIYDREIITIPIWGYLIGLVILFIPILNILYPSVILGCILFDDDLQLKDGSESIGIKIKRLLNKEF